MYLHIKNMEVQNINALAGFYMFGNVGLPTYYGFLHALERVINNSLMPKDIFGNAQQISFKEFIPVIKQSQFKSGHSKHMLYKASQKSDAKQNANAPTKDEKYYHGTVSLIVKIEGNFNFLMDDSIMEKLKLLINYLNFGGGTIVDIDRVCLFDTVETIPDSGLVYLLQSIKPVTSKEQFAQLLETYIPITVGFSGIAPKTPSNSRLVQEHQFVEPVVGFALVKHLGSVMKNNLLDQAFLIPITDEIASMYYIKPMTTGENNE